MESALKGHPVLYVDDEQDNLDAFDLSLGEDFDLLLSASASDALSLLERRRPSVLVVDQRMPEMTGLELLAQAREIHPGCVTVLLTAFRDVDVLAKALNSGLVYRYVQKPWDRTEMKVLLRQCIELYALQEENRRLVSQLQEMNRYLTQEVDWHFNHGDIVGSSQVLTQALETVRRVAPTRSTVLISGESGTGKELVARALHRLSPRRERPFVSVNLAALSPTLIESELFGHEKGSFTGAAGARRGRFELADGGTLFLDEIGDLPVEIQVKLLRVLQEQAFERVGGGETHQVDVRIVAATNKDLPRAVAQGKFREDLFYRVNVFPIVLPPLRQRKEDVPELARHFLKRFADRVGRSFLGLSDAAAAVLLAYDWPGNVRELENAVERAMIVAPGDHLEAADFHFLMPSTILTPGTDSQSLPGLMEDMEKRQLILAMEKSGGSVSAAARELKINRTTLIYRLKKYGLMQ